MFGFRSCRGSAAAQCGEALPHRRGCLNGASVEAQPRRRKTKWRLPVSQRLTALCGGKAALLVGSVPPRRRRFINSFRSFGPNIAVNDASTPASRPGLLHSGPSGLTPMCGGKAALLVAVLLLTACCLLLTNIAPHITVGLLPRVHAQ